LKKAELLILLGELQKRALNQAFPIRNQSSRSKHSRLAICSQMQAKTAHFLDFYAID